MPILILGGGITLDGNLPQHVIDRLKMGLDLARTKTSSVSFVLSGKYSFLYDHLGTYPPITEAKKMAEYLISQNISEDKIFCETDSKDTLGNAYFTKKQFFLPRKIKEAVVITSQEHIARVSYVFSKIFGPDYTFEFSGPSLDFDPQHLAKIQERQAYLLSRMKEILEPMKNGDDAFLDDKLYSLPFFHEKRPSWVIRYVTQGLP